MLDNFIVIGLVMLIVEIIKTITNLEKKDYGKFMIPILVFGLAGITNMGNAAIFGGISLVQALQEGLVLGAAAGGVYSMGKNALEKGDEYNG